MVFSSSMETIVEAPLQKKGKGKEEQHKRVGEIDCRQCDFVDTLCDKHAVYHRIKGNKTHWARMDSTI